MPNSYAQATELSCPSCQHPFLAEIWLIIDVNERPDLLTRIHAGALNDLACPQCGHLASVGAPLLVFHPNQTPPLIFVPRQGTTDLQNQQQANQLLTIQKARLGNAWQNDWIKVSDILGRFTATADINAADASTANGVADMPDELGTILAKLSRPSTLPDMPNRIALCRRALALTRRANHPYRWAALQGELGNALAQNPMDDRATNLEQAIHHFQLSIEIYSLEAFPKQWATAQNNLANAYRNRIRGERADNIEQAIDCYQQSLKVYSRQSFPEQWATTQNNLALAYRIRLQGERAENVEQTIHKCQQALKVRTRQA